ncbi:MAG: hypothetical protein AAF711_13565 [Planctomycetota bacterium]
MSLEDIKYWFEDLELRKKLEENQSIVLIALILVIVASLSMVFCHLVGGGPGSYSSTVELVYFDLDSETVRIVEHEYPDMPTSPLEGTDSVYLASVYSCQECPKGQIKDGMTLGDLKANGMFVAWIERIEPDIAHEQALSGEAYAYRTLDDETWHSGIEQGYDKVYQKMNRRCEGAWICLP